MPCGHCEGRGSVVEDGRLFRCSRCDGMGVLLTHTAPSRAEWRQDDFDACRWHSVAAGQRQDAEPLDREGMCVGCFLAFEEMAAAESSDYAVSVANAEMT